MPSGGIKKWTDEKIEAEIRDVSHSIGHFPSNGELLSLGRGNLANAISKNGGFPGWSDRTGIGRRHSDSDTGWDGERLFQSLAISRGFACERMQAVKHPFDLLLENCLRVDTKAARFHVYGHCAGWFYRIGKVAQADIVVLVQLDTQEFYGLPWWECTTSNITISRDGGKYAAYRNNWTLIEDMIETRQSERSRSVK